MSKDTLVKNKNEKAYRVRWLSTRSLSTFVTTQSPEKSIMLTIKQLANHDTYDLHINHQGIPHIDSFECVDIDDTGCFNAEDCIAHLQRTSPLYKVRLIL